MNFGICKLAAIPMRSENSHKSEMVSQLLFGECYSVLEKNGGWIKISTLDCNYEGWIQDEQYFEISSTELKYIKTLNKLRVVEPIIQLNVNRETLFPMGAVITNGDMIEDSASVLSSKSLEDMTREEKRCFLKKCAFKLLGTPYLWGGRTAFGIDCSGFTQLLFSLIGITLPRDASQQVQQGCVIDFVSEAELGDLAFFKNDVGDVVHVGILLGNSEIIHASGEVRVDVVDETGIFNRANNRYTHLLRVVKRIL